jgi:hypothetical protein
MQQLKNCWVGFYKIWYWWVTLKFINTFQLWLTLDKNNEHYMKTQFISACGSEPAIHTAYTKSTDSRHSDITGAIFKVQCWWNKQIQIITYSTFKTAFINLESRSNKSKHARIITLCIHFLTVLPFVVIWTVTKEWLILILYHHKWLWSNWSIFTAFSCLVQKN